MERKRRSGPRCVVGGCSNTKYAGYSIYELPGPSPRTGTYTSLQRAWVNFISSTRTFKASTYKKVFVCSGHFDHGQFEPTQMDMYRLGLRSKPPQLLPTAVPKLKVAEQPFPSEWFATSTDKTETAARVRPYGPSLKRKADMSAALTSQTTSSEASSSISQSTLTTPLSTESSRPPIVTPIKKRRIAKRCKCKCYCKYGRTPTTPKRSPKKRKRFDSIFSRKKVQSCNEL